MRNSCFDVLRDSITKRAIVIVLLYFITDASYTFQGSEAEGKTVVSSAGVALEHQVQPTGKTAGEEHAYQMIDSFNAALPGNVNFAKAGICDIQGEAYPKKSSDIKFQWIWPEKSDF